jgi:hypothetical protein
MYDCKKDKSMDKLLKALHPKMDQAGKPVDPMKLKAMKDSVDELKRLASQLLGEEDPREELMGKPKEVEMTVVSAGESEEPGEEQEESKDSDEMNEHELEMVLADEAQDEESADELKQKLLKK